MRSAGFTSSSDNAFSSITVGESSNRHCNASRPICRNTWSTTYPVLPTIVSISPRIEGPQTDRSSALYAHKINTLFWHGIDDATQFGFAKHQVTPFDIQTPDGEVLYAWHVLPLDMYITNEQALRDEKRPKPIVEDIKSTLAFKLLQSPDSRVVISCTSSATPPSRYPSTDSSLPKKSTATPATSPKAGEQTPTAISAGNRTPMFLLLTTAASVNPLARLRKRA